MALNKLLQILCLGLLIIVSQSKTTLENNAIEDNIQFVSDIRDKNVSSFSNGEWLVAYSNMPNPVCSHLDEIFENISMEEDFKNLKFAKITLFPADNDVGIPLVFHIKNGLIRHYEGRMRCEDMIEYIKTNQTWSESVPLVRSECNDSVFSDFSNELYNLIRGTLALAALILLFAWLIDLCSCKKSSRRDFTESLNEENAQVDTIDELIDESLDHQYGFTEKPERIIPKAKFNKLALEVVENDYVSSNSKDNEIDFELNDNEKIRPSINLGSDDKFLMALPKKLPTSTLNPFSSNESLTNSKGSTIHVGLVRGSVEVAPVPTLPLHVAQVQETKIEQSNIILTEVNTKKPKSSKSKSHRASNSKEGKMKIYKIDEINLSKPRTHETITLESKLQSKQETIIVEPVLQDKIFLEVLSAETSKTHCTDQESKC